MVMDTAAIAEKIVAEIWQPRTEHEIPIVIAVQIKKK